MRTYSTSAAHRLEQLALKVGVDCEIQVAEAQESGRYFVMTVNHERLKAPVPLGFTDEEAAYSIKHHQWERYALPGGPTRLGAPSEGQHPSQHHHHRLSSLN